MTWNELVSGQSTPTPPLTDAYRTIRMLDAAEGPVPGVLARADGGPVVLVDAGALTDWAGWSLTGAHVLAPIDVARRADGHDVVLPWCPHRLAEELRGPWRGGAALSGGQVVTLAVSLLRGVEETRRGLRGDATGPSGAWWADDAGRPVFAPRPPGGEEGDDARGDTASASAERLLRQVAEATSDRALRRPLERVLGLLEEPRGIARHGAEIEAALFEACAPQPLSFGGELSDDALDADAQSSPGERAASAPTTRRALRGSEMRERLPLDPRALTEAVWNGRVIEACSDAVHRVREHTARFLSARRAPYLIAAVAAGVVVTAGLMWPTGETHATAGEEGRPAVGGDSADIVDDDLDDTELADGDEDASVDEDAPSPDADDSADAGEAKPGGDPHDGSSAPDASGDGDDSDALSGPPDLAGATLVARVAGCVEASDLACAGTVEPGAPVLSGDDAPWADLADGEIALVDDYGDVSLITATAADTAYYLVLVRHDGQWQLRDAYAAG